MISGTEALSTMTGQYPTERSDISHVVTTLAREREKTQKPVDTGETVHNLLYGIAQTNAHHSLTRALKRVGSSILPQYFQPGTSEVMMVTGYDPSNADHQALVRGYEPVNSRLNILQPIGAEKLKSMLNTSGSPTQVILITSRGDVYGLNARLETDGDVGLNHLREKGFPDNAMDRMNGLGYHTTHVLPTVEAHVLNKKGVVTSYRSGSPACYSCSRN